MMAILLRPVSAAGSERSHEPDNAAAPLVPRNSRRFSMMRDSSRSPVGRFFDGLIADARQVRRFQPLPALKERFSSHRGQARGQQGPFHRVRRFSRVEKRLDMMAQGTEDV